MTELSVILPSYQEAENLKLLLPKLNTVLSEMSISWEILVVDTVQPMDETAEICRANGAVCLPRIGGNDYGDAIRTGIMEAIGTYILFLDADGSHDPKYIFEMYREICSGQDVVIGSRYTKGGGTHNGFILRLMSYALNVSYRFLFHLDLKDVSNSYRMYRADKLKNISLTCDNFDVVEEILIRLRLQYPTMSMKEIPIYFDRRMYGESKRDLFRFICSYFVTMSRLRRVIREHPDR